MLTLAITNVSVATMFYGVRGSYGLGEPADLITIDPITGGMVSQIGLTGMTGVGGFAVNPFTGTLYAVGGGDGTPGLHTLDPTTGAATLIGGGVTASDMGFDRSGNLYAVMADDGTGTKGELATIDLTTGSITSIGGSFSGGIGVAFDSNDNLYIKEYDWNTDESLLHTVDKTDASILSTTILDRELQNSLTIGPNNVMYSNSLWVNPSQIVTINPSTGATTLLPDTIPGLDGWIVVSAMDYSNPIPEPTTLVLMGFGLLGVLGIAIRKRRKVK